MKIAIATTGNSLEDNVALHFGKAKNFIVYDLENKKYDVYENPEVSGGKLLPPDFLAEKGVDVVISFSLGPAAFEKFKNYNIKMFKAEKGTILENLNLFQKGLLKKLTKEDIF